MEINGRRILDLEKAVGVGASTGLPLVPEPVLCDIEPWLDDPLQKSSYITCGNDMQQYGDFRAS